MKKSLTSLVLAALAGLLLSGCTTVDFLSAAVDEYCHKPESERVLFRAVVAERITPNSVIVDCR